MAGWRGAGEEGLSGAEAQEHVEADGDVVVIVGDVEGDDFLFALLVLVVLHKGEDEAAVSGACLLHLDFFLAAIDKDLIALAAAVGHLETEALASMLSMS